MRKGACFKCEEPGHLARDCKKEEGGKGKGKVSPKKDLKAIHALFKGLTKTKQMELLALSKKKDEEAEVSKLCGDGQNCGGNVGVSGCRSTKCFHTGVKTWLQL